MGVQVEMPNIQSRSGSTELSRKALQAILDVSPTGVLVFDHEERMIYANRLAEEIFGKKLTETRYCRCGDFIECSHRNESPEGCGQTPSCPNCLLYDAIHSALVGENETSPTNPVETLLEREAPLPPIWIKFKTAPVKFEGNRCVILSVDDITESKRIEDKLRESERKFRKLFTEMVSGAALYEVVCDENGQPFDFVTLEINRAFESLLGVKRADVVGKKYSEIASVDDAAYWIEIFGKVALNGETSTYSRYVSSNSRYFEGAAYSPQKGRFAVTFSDVTERVQAEKDLKASQGNLNSLIENADDIMVLRDMAGRAIVYNQAFVNVVRMLFDVEAKPGIRTLDYLPEGKREHWKSILSDVHKGKRHREEYEWEAEGGRRYYETSHNPIEVGDKIVGSAEITRDITHRKLSEKKIHDMAERLDLATRTVGLGIWDWDISNDILVWDDRMYELYGVDKDNFSNAYDAWLNGLHPDDREENDRISELARLGECEYETEFRIVRPDGSIRFVKALGQVFRNSNGTPARMIGINYDITGRKELESRLQQAQKMEAIGTLAGGIAHDFNNLLFPIVGLSEMLLEDLPKESLEYENVEEICSAAKRGSNLVDKILSFSRQTTERKEPVRIQEILNEVLKLSRATIPSNIVIHSEIQENCGRVMADPGQIHQVAMNLITNAYHAVEDIGGTITISLKGAHRFSDNIVRKPLRSGKNAVLTVSDTGCGIDASVLDKIFEPYFTTKQKGKGTGLGLSVVYGIVKEHGGDIRVSSHPGEGTTFTVSLPLMTTPSASVNSYAPEISHAGDERILVVDDEAPIVRLVSLMLERLGYDVASRTSSIDALEAFRANPDGFDLVITDMTMPNMTGDQLARELLAIKPDIPIVICTGFSDRVDKNMAESIGIKGFLMKPVVKSELAETIRLLLDEGKTIN